MSNKSPLLLAIGGALAVMSLTNPSESQYLEYSTENLCRRFDEPYKTACRVGIFAQKDNLQRAIDASTDRHNLLIGSLYTTELPGVKIQTVGILGNFVTLP